MNKYVVEYYYLATGMEGTADRKCEGVFEAESKEGAIQKCLDVNYKDVEGEGSGMYATRDSVLSWIRGCLTAHELK